MVTRLFDVLVLRDECGGISDHLLVDETLIVEQGWKKSKELQKAER